MKPGTAPREPLLHDEQRLDEALELTFPASDPVALSLDSRTGDSAKPAPRAGRERG